ncbi:MAG: hypothetical protein JETT_3400 [Candidatus Jettenia ecosi]|uniref:Uncharacterized protein n=1 Tax=Candidatus Jettenia ecosi TaxID=2494326 RepID=A0A533QCH6_9BACT|nr:MAG: hypothetical protein JETT_3400 [Candidatus Jettenia ecosi]
MLKKVRHKYDIRKCYMVYVVIAIRLMEMLNITRYNILRICTLK